MWWRWGICAALLLELVMAGPAGAQVTAPTPIPEEAGNAGASLESVIGEVTATDPAAKQITVRLDAGATVTVILQDKTRYLRVLPGETDLTRSVKITPADISTGDRVYARGRLADDRKSIPAMTVVVMTKADLAQKRERERREWQGAVAGTISALGADTRAITLSVRSPAGTRTLIVEPSEDAVFHRYAPDAVRFVQARPSSFAELNVGDSLRVLGEKNSEGTRIKAEAIVSGSFRNIVGMITAIDAAVGEIRITDLQSRRPLTVRISADTMVRRMPPAAKAAAPANRSQDGGSGAAAAGTARSGGPPRVEPTQGATGAGGQMDVERMPVVKLAQLKRDEALLVLSTAGAVPSRVTAIVVVAGIEPLLGPAQSDQTQIGNIWNFFDISLP
jgi:hypothetical protein